ncbi:MAG: sodium/proline symporter [Bacteroidetes bacterium]|jgi:sodium/proline symporter|nr:sodium/proline symporter [Bacteroidota bacterium]MBT6687527.1 sodium/proline symporter [Bacteroidota bacterium]MBT7142758.1 sodium/proline symporter [Bacteroidota bacterium]MBT7491961.1 sodium/proline symporter [Bacteroidota bacterium]
MNIQILLPFFIYFLIVIGIGIYATKFSSKGISEYFLGGRQMSKFVVALSAVVSGRSAWLLLGFVGLAYSIGFAAVWTAIGYIIIELLLFLYYAPKIRNFSEKHDCITVPDYFAARFNDKNGYLRMLIVLVFLIFMIAYISSQFVAGGKTLYASFLISDAGGINDFFAFINISQQTGWLYITALIVLIYTILGGFLAVSLTDVFQAFFMIIALVALPIYGIIQIGGWDIVLEKLSNLHQINHHTNNIIDNSLGNLTNPAALGFGALIGAIGIGLGSPGSPHIIVRYMSIKDPSQFRWTAIVGTFWNVLMAAGALFIGLIGRAYFQDVSALPDSDVENVYILLANEILNPIFVGLILASIFAAIMSTADSQLLVAASGIVRDIYQKILYKDQEISQKKLALLSRIVVSLLVIVAVIIGLLNEDLVFWFVLFAWAGLGAAIGPTSILALFWKKTSKVGVVAGLLSGTISVFVWKNIEFLKEIMYELVPAFFIALIFTIVFSLLFQDKEIDKSK